MRRTLLLLVTFAFSAFSAPVRAPGYRFYPSMDRGPLAPLAANAQRWSPDIWGSGQQLDWQVANSPVWTESWVDDEGEQREGPFASLSEVRSWVRTGLARWAQVPTADIVWGVSGIGDDAGGVHDSVNEVRVLTDDDPDVELGISYVRWWHRPPGTRQRIVECDVNMHPRDVRNPDADWRMRVLLHELGHCIGLAHAAVLPTWNARLSRLLGESELYSADPVMSYGWRARLTDDDRIGASLLRPARGWLRSTGNLAGSVSVGGAPAHVVRVTGTRLEGGRLTESVSAFTDANGAFTIEGLPPGEYLLSAGPPLSPSAHRDFPGTFPPMGDKFALTPVRVSAGQTTSVGTIRASDVRRALLPLR